MSNARIRSFYLLYYGFLNSKSGSNIHILELFQNLNKYTHIKLFVPKVKTKLNLHNIKYIPYLNKKYCVGMSYDLFLSFNLLSNFIKNIPDVVYLRQNSYSFFPVILCKIYNIPSIVEINGLICDELMCFTSKSFISKIDWYLSTASEKLNYKYCDKIVSVTQKLKDELVTLYKIPADKIVVINNGANTDLFRPLDRNEVIDELKLDSAKYYICFVGSLAPWQGVEYLIKAAPLVLKQYSNVQFLIVGDGIMKKELMQLVEDLGLSDKFIFTGSVPYDLVPHYINVASICVVPKKPIKSGYSPLKLYEYMACGKPIIATNTIGFELLEEANAGILINPENSLEFANSVLMLLNDPKIMMEMGANGRKCVVSNHSWDSVARKVLDVCNDVIKNH